MNGPKGRNRKYKLPVLFQCYYIVINLSPPIRTFLEYFLQRYFRVCVWEAEGWGTGTGVCSEVASKSSAFKVAINNCIGTQQSISR